MGFHSMVSTTQQAKVGWISFPAAFPTMGMIDI
jgi:hypothetical protein